MEMEAFLKMVESYDFTPFADAYYEVDGVVTGTFKDVQ